MSWIGSGALEDGTAKSLRDLCSVSEALTELMLGGLASSGKCRHAKQFAVDRQPFAAAVNVVVFAYISKS